MPVGQWSSGYEGDREPWDDDAHVVSRDVSPEAFMEELCTAAGGYGRFFNRLMMHYLGWWAAVVAVPALFLDHHRCEVRLPYFAWLLYSAVLIAMLIMAVLLELSMVQRLGLLRPGELGPLLTDRRWQIPLACTVLWKLDAYTDVVFIFIARDCGSSLWWASLATFIFGIVFGQLFFNVCFACTDCDRELPSSFGFMLLDFKLVNTAVRAVLPFDPDASDLPIGKPVTLGTTSALIGFGKVVGDIAQVSIQSLFLNSAKAPNGFVMFSVLCGVFHGMLALGLMLRECMQEESSMQARGVQMGTVLLPCSQASGNGYVMQLDISGASAGSTGSAVSGPVGGTHGSVGVARNGAPLWSEHRPHPTELGKSSEERVARSMKGGFSAAHTRAGGSPSDDVDMLDLL
mmetsp:Transcript_19532/g.53477  ORF Transcript_19532/g.53477 Transcript_19532/m.53477 type:complete len:402 (-) Transcript_19532:142-1347(-)